MINLIIVYSILVFLLLYFVAILSIKYNLLDTPNKRKIHNYNVPYTGGLAISLALLCSQKIFDINLIELNLILSMSLLMMVVGLLDDKFQLNTGNKIILQIFPIFYLVVTQNINLTYLGNYNFFELKLQSFAIPFSFACILLLINSFNYFDGIDGSLSFSTLSTLSILFFLTQNKEIELFLIIFSLSIIVFLFFNFSVFKLPKLFLGDSGSLSLGFIVSFILIYFANQEIAHPIILAWSVSIFVFEFLSLNIQRIKKKKSIFKPGQDHFHHLLFYKSKSIIKTNLIIFFINITMFIFGYLTFTYISSFSSLIMFIVFFFIFFYLRNFLFKYKKGF